MLHDYVIKLLGMINNTPVSPWYDPAKFLYFTIIHIGLLQLHLTVCPLMEIKRYISPY